MSTFDCLYSFSLCLMGLACPLLGDRLTAGFAEVLRRTPTTVFLRCFQNYVGSEGGMKNNGWGDRIIICWLVNLGLVKKEAGDGGGT